MSSSASPPSSPHATQHTAANPDTESLALAAQRRMQQIAQGSGPKKTPKQLLQEHELRQEFRRLIDPGILRPNTREKAIESLKILRTIGDNILREPENPKFLQFKPTNSTIKRTLVDRPGALEYAIRMGFSPTVDNFQPFYTFDSRKIEVLRLGVAMVEETLELDQQKQQRSQLSAAEEKALKAASKEKVKLAFIDDRKAVETRVEHEQATRQARASQPPKPKVANAPKKMPGPGHSLDGKLVEPAEPASSDEEMGEADDSEDET